MQKPARSTSRMTRLGGSREHGDALLEALIGVLLTVVIGLGLSYAASRTLIEQRNQSTQNAVLAQVSNAMLTTGVPSLCTGGFNVTVANTKMNTTLALQSGCTKAQITVSVTGAAALTAVLPAGVITSMNFATLSTSGSIALLGGNGVLAVTQ